MAQAAATWTNTDASKYEPGDLVETTHWLTNVLQNLEHIAQTHNHDLDTANMGAPLKYGEVKYHWAYRR